MGTVTLCLRCRRRSGGGSLRLPLRHTFRSPTRYSVSFGDAFSLLAGNLFVCGFVENHSGCGTMCFWTMRLREYNYERGRTLVAGKVLRGHAFRQTPKVSCYRRIGDARDSGPFTRLPTRVAGICGHRTGAIAYAGVLLTSDLLAIPHAGRVVAEI